jgi:hypothetical protein
MIAHLARRAVALAALAALACSGAPEDPVEALQLELEEAAEARDAQRVGARVSDSFRGPGGLGRADALASLRRYFAAYESIDLEVYGVEVERDGDQAHVRCVVEFSGQALQIGGLKGLLPPGVVYRFDLDVGDEEGVWRVREASWESVPLDGGPGDT